MDFRVFKDDKGDLIVWHAYFAAHDAMAKALGLTGHWYSTKHVSIFTAAEARAMDMQGVRALLKLFTIKMENEKPKIVWDDKAIATKLGPKVDKTKQFKGVGKPEPGKLFTQADRDDVAKVLIDAFNEKAKNVATCMDPPAKVWADAKETQEQFWVDMHAEQKLAYAKQYKADKAKENEDQDFPLSLRLPRKFDPLNETTGRDYRLTQAVAKKVFMDRAAQIVKERGIVGGHFDPDESLPSDKGPISDAKIAEQDDYLWRGWVDSSTSDQGLALQVAIAEELGERLRKKTGGGGYVTLDPDEIKKRADDSWTGGYALVKALVRAKWKTTQYMPEKAGIKTLGLYRTINIDVDNAPGPHWTMTQVYESNPHEEENRGIPPLKRMDNLKIERNGAASTTTDLDIANRWDGNDRVVLRAQVPRTAIVSVPAYGQNLHAEHECIVAGTAWMGWDAWLSTN